MALASFAILPGFAFRWTPGGDDADFRVCIVSLGKGVNREDERIRRGLADRYPPLFSGIAVRIGNRQQERVAEDRYGGVE
jgi:hypothetical protein